MGGLPCAEGAGRRPRAAVRRSRVHGSLGFRSIALNARRLSKTWPLVGAGVSSFVRANTVSHSNRCAHWGGMTPRH